MDNQFEVGELFGRDYVFWDCGSSTYYDNLIYYDEKCLVFKLLSSNRDSIGYPENLYCKNFWARRFER
jgi:hypothetical protein